VARPKVTLKLATSLDGAIALSNGASKWITGPQARHEVHRLRAAHDVVLTGIGTVLADDPLMTARDVGAVQQPLRVVLDTHGRLPATSALVQSVALGPVCVVHGPETVPQWRTSLLDAGVALDEVALGKAGYVDLALAIANLTGKDLISSIMIEAGGGVAASALGAGLVTRIEWFRAPVIFGADARNAINPLGMTAIDQARRWVRVRVEACGDDLWETYEVQ
jgi:diaminohydroxyphosphoribosylaminopyrimidine deaminase / 5-amino-6-(5-phosphoribosylamino)uracil reductase